MNVTLNYGGKDSQVTRMWSILAAAVSLFVSHAWVMVSCSVVLVQVLPFLSLISITKSSKHTAATTPPLSSPLLLTAHCCLIQCRHLLICHLHLLLNGVASTCCCLEHHPPAWAVHIKLGMYKSTAQARAHNNHILTSEWVDKDLLEVTMSICQLWAIARNYHAEVLVGAQVQRTQLQGSHRKYLALKG